MSNFNSFIGQSAGPPAASAVASGVGLGGFGAGPGLGGAVTGRGVAAPGAESTESDESDERDEDDEYEDDTSVTDSVWPISFYLFATV